jgi:hypothetical protein
MWLISLHTHVHITVLDVGRSLYSNSGADGINSFSVLAFAVFRAALFWWQCWRSKVRHH